MKNFIKFILILLTIKFFASENDINQIINSQCSSEQKIESLNLLKHKIIANLEYRNSLNLNHYQIVERYRYINQLIKDLNDVNRLSNELEAMDIKK